MFRINASIIEVNRSEYKGGDAPVAALTLSGGCASSTPTATDAAGEEAAEQPEQADQIEPAKAESVQAESGANADQPAQPAPVEKARDSSIRAVGPVAVIDGQEIAAVDFNARIDQNPPQSGRRLPPRLAKLKKTRTLDRLIDERLIDRELVAHADAISVTQSTVDDEFAQFSERFPDQDAFDLFLSRNSLSEAKLKENIRKDLKLRQLLAKRYDIAVTDQDVRDHYDANLASFEREKEVRARQIFLKFSKESDASEVSQVISLRQCALNLASTSSSSRTSNPKEGRPSPRSKRRSKRSSSARSLRMQ